MTDAELPRPRMPHEQVREEVELLPYVNTPVGEWVVRNETSRRLVLPVIAGEPRPGLADLTHDIIITVRRLT